MEGILWFMRGLQGIIIAAQEVAAQKDKSQIRDYLPTEAGKQGLLYHYTTS